MTDDGAVDRLRSVRDGGPVWPLVVPVVRGVAGVGRGQPPQRDSGRIPDAAPRRAVRAPDRAEHVSRRRRRAHVRAAGASTRGATGRTCAA